MRVIAASVQTLAVALSQPDSVNADTVLPLLVKAWPDLAGSTWESTTANKLHRWEDPRIEDGLLLFELERHGGTVNGSSQGAVHTWCVDAVAGTAKIVRRTHRQLYGTRPKLDVVALAAGVVDAVQSKTEHPAVAMRGSVLVIAAGRVPGIQDRSAAMQTLRGRRRRFRAALTEALAANGWREVGQYRFERAGLVTGHRSRSVLTAPRSNSCRSDRRETDSARPDTPRAVG